MNYLKSLSEEQEVMVMCIDSEHIESVERSIKRVAGLSFLNSEKPCPGMENFVPPTFYINGKHSWFLLKIETLKLAYANPPREVRKYIGGIALAFMANLVIDLGTGLLRKDNQDLGGKVDAKVDDILTVEQMSALIPEELLPLPIYENYFG